MEPVLDADNPMTRTVILDALLGEALPTERIEARRIRMRAGLAAGRHVHNGPVVGCVLAGDVLFQVDGQPESVLRPGDVFFEPGRVPIVHFDALDEDVTFVAYFPLTAGQEAELEFIAES
jgi:quercetin dioxygenase-like cupin family protein